MDDNDVLSGTHDAAAMNQTANTFYDERPPTLQAQLFLMVSELDREHHRGTVVIRDLIPLMDQYEREHGLTVLTNEQKVMILPFCEQNPDLELSAEDIVNLVNVAAFASAQSPSSVGSPTSEQPAQSPTFPLDDDHQSHNRHRASSTSPQYSAVNPVMTQSSPIPRRGISTASPSTGEVSALSSRPRTGPLRRGPPGRKLRSPPASPLQHQGESSFSEEDYPVSPASPGSGDDISSPHGSSYSGRRQSVPSYGHAFDFDDQEVGGSRSPSVAARYRPLTRTLVDERESSFEGIAGEEVSDPGLHNVLEDPAAQIAKFYRKSVDLTKRLKESERSLASIARQHEERIEQLQDKVDDLKKDLVTKKRELSEFKNKEKSSLQQINTLETNISQLQNQKQTYVSMKKQFEEKCEETNKLQEQLRYKESDVSVKEAELKDLKAEFEAMLKERSRLDGMRRDLEAELSAARANHVELEEQRLENEHLRETIDRLRYDLDEIRSGRVAVRMPGYGDVTGKSVVIKSLHSELAPHSEEQNDVFAEDVDPVAHLHAEALEEKLEVDAEERVRELEGEKNHYKQQVDEALLGLEQAKKMRQALEAEKRSLEAQIAQLRMQVRPEKEYANAAIQVSNQLFEIGVQCGDGDITMFEESSLDAFPSLAADIAEESTGTPRTSTLSATADAGVQCQIDRGINTELEALLNNELAKQRAIIEDLLRNKDMSAEVQGKPVVVDMPMMNDDKGIRQRKVRDKKKSRISFQDMNDLTDAMGNNTSVARRRPVSMAGMPPMAMLARSNDKIVTNTITFALYTLVVYLFGIVTSTFLIETGQTTGAWEMALQGAGGMNGGPKSKVFEVVFWIIERVLLLDGDTTPLMPS